MNWPLGEAIAGKSRWYMYVLHTMHALHINNLCIYYKFQLHYFILCTVGSYCLYNCFQVGWECEIRFCSFIAVEWLAFMFSLFATKLTYLKESLKSKRAVLLALAEVHKCMSKTMSWFSESAGLMASSGSVPKICTWLANSSSRDRLLILKCIHLILCLFLFSNQILVTIKV